VSAEVRWFVKGIIPDELFSWFGEGALVLKELSRIDLYFALPDQDDLGIKVRDGRIEIKHRKAVIGAWCLENGVKGQVEKWDKWRLELANSNSYNTQVATFNETWVPVIKSRSVRKYEWRSQDQLRTVSAESEINEGCGVELTEINFRDQRWWTFGLEAFGTLKNVETILRLALDQTLSTGAVSHFKIENSYSYPHWLGIVLKDSRNSNL